MRGKALCRRTIAEKTNAGAVTADRTIASLLLCPGVAAAREGKRRVIRFDPARIGGVVSTGTAVAAALSSSLASLFAGSQYERGIREATQGVVDRTRRRREFHDLDRKFFFLARGGEVALQGDAGQLDDVIEALLTSERIRVRYLRFGGRSENLELEPLSLAVHEHQLYLIARSSRHQAYAYRYSRIQDVERLEERFGYPARCVYDPEALLVNRFGVFLSDDHEIHTVRLRLSPRWRTYAETNRWHPTQTVSVDAQGVLLSLSVRTCPELVAWILGFAEEVEVLAPASLREAVAERHRAAAARYRSQGQVSMFGGEAGEQRKSRTQTTRQSRGALMKDRNVGSSRERPQLGLFASADGVRRGAPTGPRDLALSRESKAILRVLEKSKEPLGKAALLKRAKVADAAWRRTINELLDAGRAEARGPRGKVRYALIRR